MLSIGLFLLCVYFVCVVYPFHFNGYADLEPGFWYGMEPLGITRFIPVGVVTYIFSTTFTGIVVLAISMLCIIIGTRKMHKAIRIGLIVPTVSVVLFAFTNLDRYNMLNVVFE